MQAEWEKYLLDKIELLGLRKKNRKTPTPRGFGIQSAETSVMRGESNNFNSINQLENDALLAAASEISNLAETKDKSEYISSVPSRMMRHGKRKVGKDTAKMTVKKSKGSLNNILQSDCSVAESKGEGFSSENVLRKHNQIAGSVEKPLPPVQLHALDCGKNILDNLKPSVIIVYHPDVRFVREIEVYQAENPLKKLKVYFLFYEDSTESLKFEASVRRENAAFESLIRQKSLMMIPVDQVIL